MQPDRLTSLLAAGAANDPERTPACPDEHEISGYVDGELDDAASTRIELHLADCRRCLAIVGLLSTARNAGAIEPVPDEIVAQARALVTKRPQRSWHVAPRWAAAAALVLAVPLVFQLARNAGPGDADRDGQQPPATRTTVVAPAGLRLLSPGAGAAVDARMLSFRWTEVPGTPYYDVRVVTDAGDIVTEQRVTGTAWQPSATLNLRPGAEYYVHIDAYPSGDKAVSSDHVPFRISR